MLTEGSPVDEESGHVQELKKWFLASNVDENQCLGRAGLLKLFEKLKLSDYANIICDKVLRGAASVDFENFKERFIAFLPEIIDTTSGAVDSLLVNAHQTIYRLGFKNTQRLTRSQARQICEKTHQLSDLSTVDINAIFERADSDHNGRVSLQQFLTEYRLQKRLSQEVHFIADSYIPSFNLFESLDPRHTGRIDIDELMEQWNKSGLRVDEGLSVLKDSGLPGDGVVNPVHLTSFLERELTQASASYPSTVKAAIIALHGCIDHMRLSVREGELRSEYLLSQLQSANQRRTLLIEELEQNQMSIEEGYEKRLRETEERFKTRISQMEEKFRTEKKELQSEIELVEEELSRARQQEASARNKLLILERQTARLNEESQEQSETISQLEQLNRQLRTELSKAMHPRPMEDNKQLFMWKQKMDLLTAHNKRLREKLQNLTTAQKKKARMDTDGEAFCTRWSRSFVNQMMLIRRRRLLRGDSLSEMDSEPESIFVRHKRRRLLKRKDRKTRHQTIMSRIATAESEEDAKSPRIQEHALVQGLEMQLQKLTDDHKQELAMVRTSASKAMAEAMCEQEKQINAKLERERRQFELRLNSEKSQLERQFAEEKMKLMNRLQEDFDTELKRIADMVHRSDDKSSVEQYKQQIRVLESSLEVQKTDYEKRMNEMRERLNNSNRPRATFVVDKTTSSFASLLEQYRNNDNATSSPSESFASPRSLCSIEKRPAQLNPFQRSLSSMSKTCAKCSMVADRLREISYTINGDQTSAESGIEDIESSAGMSTEDNLSLKREIRKLKGRLDASKEKLTELRVYLAVDHPPRYKGHSDLSSTRWSDMSGTIERLESEKLILETRLVEMRNMMRNVMQQLKDHQK